MPSHFSPCYGGPEMISRTARRPSLPEKPMSAKMPRADLQVARRKRPPSKRDLTTGVLPLTISDRTYAQVAAVLGCIGHLPPGRIQAQRMCPAIQTTEAQVSPGGPHLPRGLLSKSITLRTRDRRLDIDHPLREYLQAQLIACDGSSP
jgi:hypothetical protein